MDGAHVHDAPAMSTSRRWGWPAKLAFTGFLAVALFFLLTEHRAHFFGLLPYLLLAACPLLHFSHHGRHAAHNGGASEPPVAPVDRADAQAVGPTRDAGHDAAAGRQGIR